MLFRNPPHLAFGRNFTHSLMKIKQYTRIARVKIPLELFSFLVLM